MKDESIKIRLSERDKNELKNQAKKLDMNMSQYITYLIHINEEKAAI